MYKKPLNIKIYSLLYINNKLIVNKTKVKHINYTQNNSCHLQ